MKKSIVALMIGNVPLKGRQWLAGMGISLAFLILFWRVVTFLPMGIGIGLILLGVGSIAIGWVWLTYKRSASAFHLAQVLKLWPVAAGLAVPPLVLVPLLLVGSFSNQPPAPCSTVRVPSDKPPVALVTAEDYFAQGNYDYDRGDCDRAIADYSRAIGLKPNYAEAYNNRAYTYMVKHEFTLALPDLDQAIQNRPDYINALMNRGDIHNFYYDIDYDQAIADYDRVVQLGGEHTSVCGHRMLAQHHGWNLGTVGGVLTLVGEGGCTGVNTAH